MISTAFVTVLTFVGFNMLISQTQAQTDLLEVMFKPSKTFDYQVDLGNSRDSVGKAFLRDSFTIGSGKTNDPIIIRVVKWFLEIIVILGVPLLLGGAIMYITSAGDEGKQKKARAWMINVVVGIVLALSSLAIVTFVSSLLNDSRLGGL